MDIVKRKEIAVECLEKLDIYKPYIMKFKSKAGTPCFFENFAGFYADQEPELWNKIKEVEKEYGCIIYAVTHEMTNFGECWSMLCVSADSEGMSDCLDTYRTPDTFSAYSYVWNTQADYFSEFGDIIVKSFGGGIKRIY